MYDAIENVKCLTENITQADDCSLAMMIDYEKHQEQQLIVEKIAEQELSKHVTFPENGYYRFYDLGNCLVQSNPSALQASPVILTTIFNQANIASHFVDSTSFSQLTVYPIATYFDQLTVYSSSTPSTFSLSSTWTTPLSTQFQSEIMTLSVFPLLSKIPSNLSVEYTISSIFFINLAFFKESTTCTMNAQLVTLFPSVFPFSLSSKEIVRLLIAIGLLICVVLKTPFKREFRMGKSWSNEEELGFDEHFKETVVAFGTMVNNQICFLLKRSIELTLYLYNRGQLISSTTFMSISNTLIVYRPVLQTGFKHFAYGLFQVLFFVLTNIIPRLLKAYISEISTISIVLLLLVFRLVWNSFIELILMLKQMIFKIEALNKSELEQKWNPEKQREDNVKPQIGILKIEKKSLGQQYHKTENEKSELEHNIKITQDQKQSEESKKKSLEQHFETLAAQISEILDVQKQIMHFETEKKSLEQQLYKERNEKSELEQKLSDLQQQLSGKERTFV